MNFKRICMGFISLMLVVCLLVNASPIKTEAIAIESAVAIGCAAVLTLASCGVIFHPQTQKEIETIGNAFSTYLYQWGTSAEKLTEVDEFVGGLTLYDGSGDDGDDGYDQMWKYAKGGIWGGIAAFIVGAIFDNCIKAEGEPLDGGFWSYNGFEAAPIPDDVDRSNYPYAYVGQYTYNGSKSWRLCLSSKPLRLYDSSKYGLSFMCDSDVDILLYAVYSLPVNSWGTPEEVSYLANTHIKYMGFRSGYAWSNVDVYGADSFNGGALYLEGSEPIKNIIESFAPDTYIGDIPDKVKNNEYDVETLPLPDTLYYGNIIDPDLGAVQSVINLADDLTAGKITFEEYKTLITTPPQVDPVPDPSEPDVTTPSIDVPAPDIDSDTLADSDPNTFLEQLGAYITSPFRWIWSNIKTYFEPLTRPELWTETIPEIVFAPARWIWEKIQTELAPLFDPDTLARPLPEIIAAPFQNLWNNLQNAFDSLRQTADNAAQKVVDGLKEATVPDKDYLSDKVNALLAEYAFADSIVNTAKSIKMGLAGVTTEPPVIYIHLEDNRGSYDWGGTVPFLDLRWYAEYKPTVDALISAFLWICFAWKMLLKLPGIISGMPGDFVMDSVHHIGMSEHMPVRKAEYEVQRASNRQYIRKGKDG